MRKEKDLTQRSAEDTEEEEEKSGRLSALDRWSPSSAKSAKDGARF